MYGKFFSSTFTGSMFGAGPSVFALWGYVIANAVEGSVEINPALVAAVLGADVAAIEAARDYLCAPDPSSRSREADGRRLVAEGGFQYRVVNHAAYRAIRNEDDRRAYNRDAQRRSRANRQPASNGASLTPYKLSTLSAHTEAEAEAETEAETEDQGQRARATNPRAAPPAGNPHHKPTNLINGADLRRHATHAWCSFAAGRDGLCVSTAMHQEFQAKGVKTDAQMRDWYQQTIARFAGTPIGDDPYRFWRNEFAAWIGTVTSAPADTKAGRSIAGARRVIADIRAGKPL